MGTRTTVAVGEHHHERTRFSPAPAIAGECPQVSGFGFASARVKDRRSCLVHEQVLCCFDVDQHVVDDGLDVECGDAAP